MEEHNEPEKKEDVEQQQEVDVSSELIDRANQAAERIEKANEALAKNLARQERIAVEQRLGGSAHTSVAPPPEESPQDYAKKVMRGEVDVQ